MHPEKPTEASAACPCVWWPPSTVPFPLWCLPRRLLQVTAHLNPKMWPRSALPSPLQELPRFRAVRVHLLLHGRGQEALRWLRLYHTGAQKNVIQLGVWCVCAQVLLPLYGCDCYAYGLLAAGFCDLVVEADMKPYDYMALVPVVQGAGGCMTDWQVLQACATCHCEMGLARRLLSVS